MWRRLRGYFSPRAVAVAASRVYCRLDYPGNDLPRANSVLRFFSILPGSEPLGPLLYHFYVDGNLGPMCSLALIVSVVCITLILVARRIGKVGNQFEGH